jgi:hypothetical protein
MIEPHADEYVAYPIGLKSVVVGQGDPYEEALVDVRSNDESEDFIRNLKITWFLYGEGHLGWCTGSGMVV